MILKTIKYFAISAILILPYCAHAECISKSFQECLKSLSSQFVFDINNENLKYQRLDFSKWNENNPDNKLPAIDFQIIPIPNKFSSSRLVILNFDKTNHNIVDNVSFEKVYLPRQGFTYQKSSIYEAFLSVLPPGCGYASRFGVHEFVEKIMRPTVSELEKSETIDQDCQGKSNSCLKNTYIKKSDVLDICNLKVSYMMQFGTDTSMVTKYNPEGRFHIEEIEFSSGNNNS